MTIETTRLCAKCNQVRPITRFEKYRGEMRRNICRYCRGGKRRAPTPEHVDGLDGPKIFSRPLKAKKYLITSAQNATPVHEGFLAALKVAAKHMGAELVVIPTRYKNPTSVWTSSQENQEWWGIHPRTEMRGITNPLEGHLFNVRRKLAPNLVLCADVKIQPTASSPLTGFQSLTGAESCIIGHPKMALDVIPAPSGRFPKLLSTTGACTKRNYTDTKAGKLGEFHHFLGAVVIELKGKKFFLRQINADRNDGSFIDKDKWYSAEGVTAAPAALGINLGDTHARFADKKVDRATFGPGGIVETLDCHTIIFNDLLDGYAVNPHHEGNPFIAQAKSQAGLGNVEAEVVHAVKFIVDRCKGRQAVIVPSNHDNFLARWIIAADWKRLGSNAGFYLETAQAMRSSVKMTDGGALYADPFTYWVRTLAPTCGDDTVRALDRDESFVLGDAECGLHGDKGPNGARGSLKNLSRLGCKTNIGHSHTPGIREGGYQSGTSTALRLEYNGGPSSWLNAHIVTYANKKRAIYIVIDGEWHAP